MLGNRVRHLPVEMDARRHVPSFISELLRNTNACMVQSRASSFLVDDSRFNTACAD